MSKNASYYDLLRHPNWQQKRLRIMERARFRCEDCDDKDTTLNIHHSYYEKGKKPWEYPDESLRCLCEDCHKQVEIAMQSLKLATARLTADEIYRVIGYAKGVCSFNHPAISIPVSNEEPSDESEIIGLIDAWGLPLFMVEEVAIEAAKNGGEVTSEFLDKESTKIRNRLLA